MYNYSEEQMAVYREFKEKFAIKSPDFLKGYHVPIYRVTVLKKACLDEKVVTWVGKYQDLPGKPKVDSLTDTYWFIDGTKEYDQHSCRDYNMHEGDGYNCHLVFLNKDDALAYIEAYKSAPEGTCEPEDDSEWYDYADDYDYYEDLRS